jgi:hypothetical protein
MFVYYHILDTIAYPAQRPTIPATPAKTGGAGTGSLIKANTTPQTDPVIIESAT